MARSSKSAGALTLLKQDHAEVKDLFDEFEDSEDLDDKKTLAIKAISELKVHARVEEEIFYPALRQAGAADVVEEADEEHHVAKLLIAELELMNGSEENFEAKFTVLAENVRHHIKEEEKEVFAAARKAKLDLDALGQAMAARKQELKSSGVPVDDEEQMVRKTGLIPESPSKRAAHDFQFRAWV